MLQRSPKDPGGPEGSSDLTDAPTPLRVATWNLNHWRQPLLPVDTRRGAWAHLAGPIGAQVALVQEAVPSVDVPPGRAVYGEIAGHRNWGSAVVVFDPGVKIEPIRSVRTPWSKRRYLLEGAHPGSVAVARVTVPGIQPECWLGPVQRETRVWSDKPLWVPDSHNRHRSCPVPWVQLGGCRSSGPYRI